MSRTVMCLLLLASMLLTARPAIAQRDSGDILGTVRDASGAVLPGVAITITNTGTGLTRTVMTNESGDYVVANLPVGVYNVSARLDGFQTAEANGIRLGFDQRARINLDLKVGAIAETLTVVSQTPLIDTDSSTLGQVMTSQTIEQLPLGRRDFMQLTLLLPGSLPPQANSTLDYFRGAVQVNGVREDGNNFMLDGMQNRDDTAGVIVVQPSLDAIAEFKILSSTYAAEYGHAGGAQIAIITKSGTNQYRGSAFGFLRDESLDGRNYFTPDNQDKPEFNLYQMGGSIGGPVFRNKTFFFSNYERRQQDKAIPKATSVPTDAMRAGNFSGRNVIYDPATLDPVTGTRQPFPNNVIPSNRISPIAAEVTALLPRANQPGALNYLGQPLSTDDVHNLLGRVDHKIDDANSLIVRYAFYDNVRFGPYQRFNNTDIPGFGDTFTSKDHVAMVAWQHLRGSNKVNEFKVGYTSLDEGWVAENQHINYPGMLGIQGLGDNPRDWGMPVTSISGIGAFGDNSSTPQTRYSWKYELVESFTLTRGAHVFKTGASIAFYGQGLDIHSRASFRFTPNFTTNPSDRSRTGDAYADFLLGYPTSTSRVILGAEGEAGNTRTQFYQLYVQDDWEVASRLTLNIGLRYEYNTPYYDANNRRGSFDPETGTVVTAMDPGQSRGLYNTDKTAFAPRLGLAWRVTDRTVVRSGYGIFYTPENGNSQDNLSRNPPFRYGQTFTAAPLIPNITYANPYPESLTASGVQSASGIYQDFPSGRVTQWNANVEHQLSLHLAANVGYVGSKGTYLQNGRQINVPRPGPGAIQGRRPYPQYANISMFCACFPSNYHALQAKLQGRWGTSTLLGSYTLSKSTDILSSFYGGGSIQNWYDLEDSRGPSNFDRRHSVVVSFAVDLPFGAGRKFLSDAQGIVNALVSDWNVSVVSQNATGNPLTITLPFDNSNTGVLGDRPNTVAGVDPVPSEQGPGNWINPAAFVAPPQFTYGNAGRNSVTGPGRSQFDLSVIRDVGLNGERQLQLRFEVFNLFNRANFFNPGTALGTAQFGRISQAYDGRNVQIGARFTF
jgi:outer membrane receptor protein involved in Fe transport